MILFVKHISIGMKDMTYSYYTDTENNYTVEAIVRFFGGG